MTENQPIISECQSGSRGGGGGGATDSLPESMVNLKTLISDLPEDTKTKILSKLPATCLIRLKCVTKRWYSLITADFHLLAAHLLSQYDSSSSSSSSSSQLSLLLAKNSTSSPNSTPSRILLLRDAESDVVEIHTLSIGTHRRHRKVPIDDMTVCSNGLVCLFSKNSSKIILWNPMTRESRNLPEPPRLPFRKRLFCHVTINSVFDPRNNDFKLVRMAQICEYLYRDNVKDGLIIHVFSLKTNCWREAERYSRFKASFSSCRGVELNGVLYWLGIVAHGILSLKHGVLSFDISVEEFRELDTPNTGRSKTEVKEIVKWKRKSLAVIIESLYTDEFGCWSMENDVSFCSMPTWTKWWAVRAPFPDSWRWLGVWRDRCLVVRSVSKVGRKEEEMLSFDLPSGEQRQIFGKKVMDNSEVKVFNYVESLVSIYFI